MKPHSYGTYGAATDGAIVQLVSERGERRTIVSKGVPPGRGPVDDEGVVGSIRRAIKEAEGWPGSWKVEVISTPATILADLRGERRQKARPRLTAGAGDPRVEATWITPPERIFLGKIGRLDMAAR